jgi:hypothetical protein
MLEYVEVERASCQEDTLVKFYMILLLEFVEVEGAS